MALVAALLLTGCSSAKRQLDLAWTFEARRTAGEVRVVPVVDLHEPLALDRSTFVGLDLPWEREGVRRERTAQLAEIPEEVRLALPGAVNGELGRRWNGQFRVGSFPMGGHERVEAALRRGTDVDRVLEDLARAVGGQATLFTWVSDLSGRPLTAEGFPGDILETPRGPVVVDHWDEPYWVTASVGMALVTSDGEVVLRYADTYEAVLSARQTPDRVGRELAQGLAAEVVKVWAVDPRLAPARTAQR